MIGNFSKIIACPGINLVLTHGEKESVTVEFSGIEDDKINAYVNKNTLMLYLDGARMKPKQSKVRNGHYSYKTDTYDGAKVTAYVTYEYLERLEVRGENLVVAEEMIKSPKINIIAYGENEIVLPAIESFKMKSRLYGENRLNINTGECSRQTFKSYGDNEINAIGFEGRMIKGKIYGEGLMNVHAKEKLSVTAFGEADIKNAGPGMIKRKIVIGDTSIRKVATES